MKWTQEEKDKVWDRYCINANCDYDVFNRPMEKSFAMFIHIMPLSSNGGHVTANSYPVSQESFEEMGDRISGRINSIRFERKRSNFMSEGKVVGTLFINDLKYSKF